MLLAFPGTLRPAQSPFPQGWRISVILKISALHPIQATRSGVFHIFHPFFRDHRVARATL